MAFLLIISQKVHFQHFELDLFIMYVVVQQGCISVCIIYIHISKALDLLDEVLKRAGDPGIPAPVIPDKYPELETGVTAGSVYVLKITFSRSGKMWLF